MKKCDHQITLGAANTTDVYISNNKLRNADAFKYIGRVISIRMQIETTKLLEELKGEIVC